MKSALNNLAGMARCAVPARSETKGGTNVVEFTHFARAIFRRLTLRSATGTVQRAIPASREKLTRTANFLPGKRQELPGQTDWLLSGLIDLLGFAGVFRNHAENLTMAQPLLKGELR